MIDYYDNARQYKPIDVINDWQLNFNLGNAIKYISRAGRKDGASVKSDLYKAIAYIAYEVGDSELFADATSTAAVFNNKDK